METEPNNSLTWQDSFSWSGHHCLWTCALFISSCGSLPIHRAQPRVQGLGATELMYGHILLGILPYWTGMTQIPTCGPMKRVMVKTMATNGSSWKIIEKKKSLQAERNSLKLSGTLDYPRDKGNKRLYYIFQFINPLPGEARAGTQGKNLQAGAGWETTAKCCLLALSPCLVQPAVLHCPGPPAWGCHLSLWAVHMHLSHWCECPPELLQTSLMEPFSQMSVLFPNDSSLCQVDIN